MKPLNIALFLCLFFSATAYANATCKKEARLNFLKANNSLYAEYSKIDPKQVVTTEKKAFWIDGDPKISKALFLAHGYMGSPGEMMFLAEPFVKKGWTIIGFLVPGHGSTYEVANFYKNARWTKELKEQLSLVTNCFAEVRAVGFSTGGLLLHQYAISPEASTNLKSLHLISPYYIQRFGGFFDRALGYLVNGISVDTAYFITRFKDLKVMTIDRKNYHQNIPIDSALQVKELGLSIFELEKTYMRKIPVQLFLSEGDWTVDIDKTKIAVNRDFEKVQLVWYKGDEPHHLMAPSVSKVAGKIQKLISEAHLEAELH